MDTARWERFGRMRPGRSHVLALWPPLLTAAIAEPPKNTPLSPVKRVRLGDEAPTRAPTSYSTVNAAECPRWPVYTGPAGGQRSIAERIGAADLS